LPASLTCLSPGGGPSYRQPFPAANRPASHVGQPCRHPRRTARDPLVLLPMYRRSAFLKINYLDRDMTYRRPSGERPRPDSERGGGTLGSAKGEQ